jgi:hypothetical protein
MKIEIPLPEKVSTNTLSRQHWTKRKKLVDLYNSSLIEYRNKTIKDYPVEITYIFTFKKNPLDTTNCMFMAKFLEDSLVRNNIIEDDDPKHVAFTGIYSQKGKEDKVEIIIT